MWDDMCQSTLPEERGDHTRMFQERRHLARSSAQRISCFVGWIVPLVLWLLLAAIPLHAGSDLLDSIVGEATKLGLKKEEISFSFRLPDGSILEHRALEARAPASCMKLVVAAAVLDRLGPGHLLRTDLMRLGEVQDGILQGNLLVVGGGDPAICGREDGDDSLWELRPWIDKIRAAGIEQIQGKVLADVRYLSGPGIHPDWPEDQLLRWYCAPSGALNLNDNCIDVIIGPVENQQVRVMLDPPHSLLRLNNQLQLTANKKSHLYHITRKEGDWEITVRGKFLKTSGERTEWITVPDPADAFVSIFLQMVKDAGIVVTGDSIAGSSKGVPLATIEHTVSSRLGVMLKNSQNLYADALARVIGREAGGDGSFQSVATELSRWIDEKFPGHPERLIRDGSGLSRKNRLDARLLRQLIDVVDDLRGGGVLLDALPVGAVDGTLKKRLRGTKVAGKVRAKTGTIRGVSSLAGRLDGATGPTSFCMIFSGRNGFTSRARDWQDRALLRVYKALAADPVKP